MSSQLPPPCETPAAPAEVAPCPHPRGTLTATVLGSCLTFVVGAIINVALPAMRAGLATDAAGAQWIVNAYLLPVGALVLLGGALGDHYGRRRVFLLGLTIFALGSLACALAPALGWFLAARSAQGLGAALRGVRCRGRRARRAR
jgi:MFS family permease